MKNTFRIIKEIFQEKILLQRILQTIFLVTLFRTGTYIILPGINPKELITQASGILAWLDSLLGGALQSYSPFSLGIYPYISASIMMQFISLNIPYFQRLKKEGAPGRAKLNHITRLLTLIITPAQASIYLYGIVSRMPLQVGKYYFIVLSLILLVAGTMISIWIADQITQKGIGNGSSVLITTGILSTLPHAFAKELTLRGFQGALIIVFEIAILSALILLLIYFTQAVRRVPLQQAKAIYNPYGSYGGRREYLPLKLNGAGVMPIIMASMISALPRLLGHLLRNKSEIAAHIAQVMQDMHGWQYNLFLFIIIFATNFIYTAIFISPIEMANTLKQRNAFIPGIKPGKPTSNFIDYVLTKITLPSSFFLGIIAVLPAFAVYVGITKAFGKFYGGTSLIIVIGTMIEIVQQTQTYLFNRRYSEMVAYSQLSSDALSNPSENYEK